MIKNKDTIQYREDKKTSIALMSSFVVLTIQYLVLIYFNFLGSSTGAYIQLLSKALVGLIFLYILPGVFKRNKTKFINIYFIASFIWVTQYVIFPENREYIIDLIFPLFFMSLPAFIYTLSIRDFAPFLETIKKSSYIIFLIGLIISVLVFTGRATMGVYSMSLSYYMLLPAIMFLDKFLEEFSLIGFILLSISLFIILSLGSRGAILCISIYVLLKFFRQNSKKTYLQLSGLLGLLSIGVMSLVFLDKILLYIYNLALNFGIRSRTLWLFLHDTTHLSGRDRLYKDVIAETLDNPLIGVGIFGDRRIIGGYVHNFFIEIIANFGLVIGFIISTVVIILIIKSLLNKDKDKYNLTIIWLCLGFVHLMVSSSYLTDIKFWIFIGLIINFNLRSRSVRRVRFRFHPSKRQLTTSGRTRDLPHLSG